MDEQRSGGFLPPEPAGPEPELGSAPGGAAHPAPARPGPAGAGRRPAGAARRPAAAAHPAAGPAGGLVPAAATGLPAAAALGLRPAARARQRLGRGRLHALVVAGSLLLFSGGLSSIVSIGCAIVGIIYSRKGKQKVDAGETRKNRGLAQAGFIIGIVEPRSVASGHRVLGADPRARGDRRGVPAGLRERVRRDRQHPGQRARGARPGAGRGSPPELTLISPVRWPTRTSSSIS